ncbi:methyltransferase domain-containing protein [Amycolatopsis sp. NPDC098790]|uniref:methyltransferase domain-containing protein n=1 Tax=Amycolatopsis sp. NPDC098790 TaxID=3363939 RepID=UPI00382134CD
MTSELLARLDLADSLPGAADLREATYELLRCGPGDRVLDVGCGGGRAVAELCARGARAVGADLDPRMLAAARARSAGGPPGFPAADGSAVPAPALAARARGSSPAAEFVEADVLRLPFADGEFRGYRADKVLHELADPAAAVAEARRVLAPGGRIVLCGQDWDTLVLDSDRPALTRALVHARADAVAGPRAARQYRALLVDAGFTEVAVEVRTVVDTDGGLRPLLDGLAAAARDTGVATDAQLDAWLGEQSTRADAGRFFLAVPIFVASATKRPQ